MRVPLLPSLLIAAAMIFTAGRGAVGAEISTTMEAEHCDSVQGITHNPAVNVDYFDCLTGIGNNDWVRFDSVDFEGGCFTTLALYYWCSWPSSGADATIRARIDSPTGATIGTISPLPEGADHMHDPSRNTTTALSQVSGVHALYLTFQGSSSICDLDKIKLSGAMAVNPADAKTYYVSPAGNDANDGLSTGSAFRTISRAASVMKPGGRCLIRQGIYRETVKPLHTGLAGAPIAFEAYGNDLVYISGADPITGWSLHSGSIYKAQMPWSLGRFKDQVIVDGKMAWVARCPNVDDGYMPDPNDGNMTWCSGGFAVRNWKKWQTAAEPIAVPMRVCMWGSSGAQSITATIDNNPSPNQLPAALFNRPADYFKGGLVVMHDFYWQNAGYITGSQSGASSLHISAAPSDLQTPNAGGPGWISHVFGLLDTPNEWYRDSASKTLYLWAPGGGDPSPRVVEAKRRVLGMDLRGKQYVNVKGLRFIAASMTLANASHCVVDGCYFRYVSHNDVPPQNEMGVKFEIQQETYDGRLGVCLAGDNNTIKNSSVRGSAASGIIVGGSNNTITNCRITACDYAVTYHAGILVMRRNWNDPTDGMGIDISRNSLSFNARANVQVGAALSGGVKIHHNDFGAAAYTTVETGSVAGQSANNIEVCYNLFHDVESADQLSVCLEQDFGSWAWSIHHNVFWEGRGPAEGVLRAADWALDIEDINAKCFNNTVVDEVDQLHQDWQYCQTWWPGFMANILFAKSDTAPWKFTDPVNRDYTLRAGSPAIDKGVVVPGFTFQGSAPDLGAYEYGEPRWTAGADWAEQPWTYPPPQTAAFSGAPARARSPDGMSLRPLNGSLLIVNPARRTAVLSVFNAAGKAVIRRAIDMRTVQTMDMRPFTRAIYMVRLTCAGQMCSASLLLGGKP